MDPITKIYFSDKQVQHQVNNIFEILKLPMDEDYYALCVKIVKTNNAQLYHKFIHKKPPNMPLKLYLKKLNKKSTLDSAKMFYDKVSQQSFSASNSSTGFASINDVGKNPFGEFIQQQGFHPTRMVPQVQNRMDNQADGMDFQQRLAMMQMERDQFKNQFTPQQLNGFNPFLEDCSENRRAMQRHQTQMTQQTNNPQNNGMNPGMMKNMNPQMNQQMNQQMIEPMTQTNNQSGIQPMNNMTSGTTDGFGQITGGFIATDIFSGNNGAGGTDLNSAFNGNMISKEEIQKYKNNTGKINISALQQQRSQDIANIPINQQQAQQFISTGQQPQNYAQMIGQGNFKQVGVNDSSTLINKNQFNQLMNQQMNQGMNQQINQGMNQGMSQGMSQQINQQFNQGINQQANNSMNNGINPQINPLNNQINIEPIHQPILFTCNSEQLIPEGKPKNMFTIRSNNELLNVKAIKLTNFEGLHNIPNINNENNKINISINDNEISKEIKPDNYQISDLLDLLNNELDNVLFEFMPDDSYKISVKYLDSDITSDKVNTFTIYNTQNSIFRVLGFTENTYSDKTEYISEEPVNLTRIPPFYLYMLINNNKMYKFNIRELSKIYKKEFKESINNIHTITFMAKQENDQMYDLQNYISFDIEFD